MKRPRVGVVTSHPIQYNGPLFRRIAERGVLDLTVIYCSTLGLDINDRPMRAFGRSVSWDVDLLSGYRSVFLRGARRADPERRRGVFNPDVVGRLARDGYDAIVGFGWGYPTLWLTYATGRLMRTPYLLYSDTDVRRYDERSPFRRRQLIYRLLCRHAAGALYTGTFNRDFYVRSGMGVDRLWFSPLAVDNARFEHADRDASRVALGLRDGVVYALFVGSLIDRKRPLLLLNAVRQLQDQGLPVGVVIAGDGPLRSDVEAALAGVHDAHLLGFVNQARLPSVYAAADIFVLPSVSDARGTVVNEAMAAGLPVVVSTGIGVWGPGDLIDDGLVGRLFRVDDADALVKALESLLLDEARRTAGIASQRRVGEWNYDVAAEGWESAVAHITGKGR